MESEVERRFVTSGGVGLVAVSAAEMREIDRIAVEETGPSLLQMMENAGRSMAALAIDLLGESHATDDVLVVAGTGGNGGGGICAARHLSSRVEHVDLWLVEPDRMAGAASMQLSTYRETAGCEVSYGGLRDAAPYAILVDAVIGYGLRGAPSGASRDAVEWIRASSAKVLSLDLPSGIDPDTGEAPGVYVDADATLTLHLPKPGLRTPAAGRLFLADLGIPAGVSRRLGIAPPIYGSTFVTPLLRPRQWPGQLTAQ